MPVLHAARALTPDGWKSDVRVTIDGGAIATMETEAPAQEGDERHTVMAPAVANLHSHAFQRAMAGLAEVRGNETDTFWTWRETMYRFALMMSPDDMEAVAAQLYVEMLEAGFAAVAEFHYLHHSPDGSPYAAASGNGRTHSVRGGPRRYRHDAASGVLRPFDLRRRAAQAGAEAVHQRSHDIRASRRGLSRHDQGRGETIGVAPHSLRAVTPSELSERSSLAGDGPIHIHAAEQIKEVEDCVASLGARPVRWLIDHAGVDKRWCLVHATHMDEGETRDLARSGRGRRALSGDGGQSWRRDLQRGWITCRRRPLWRRHRFQCLDWRRSGIAPARICAEAARAGAQCLRSSQARHVDGRCSRRSGWAARRP